MTSYGLSVNRKWGPRLARVIEGTSNRVCTNLGDLVLPLERVHLAVYDNELWKAVSCAVLRDRTRRKRKRDTRRDMHQLGQGSGDS